MQVLIAFSFSPVRIEGGSHHIMGFVFNTKNKISLILFITTGGIGKGGQVFSKGVRFRIIFLEFEPLRFILLFAQMFY